MIPDAAAHRARPWRVHTLAPDFELLDLWDLPLAADPARGESFADVLRLFTEASAGGWPRYPLHATSPRDVVQAILLVGTMGLIGFRRALGRLLALDDGGNAYPIPGCREHRIRERLDDTDRARDTGAFARPKAGGFQPVYAFADEALLELANRTIHGLLHLSWVASGASEQTPGRYGVVLAIYVKSRGWQSRAYMGLIRPFRHLVVYPAWISHLTRTWAMRHPTPDPLV